MTWKTKFGSFYLLLFLFFCCKKPNPPESPNPPEPPIEDNKPPSAFSVTVLKTSSNYVSIEWTAATDPENDAIIYSICINDSIVKDSISNVFTCKIDNLKPEKHYTGYVQASDSKLNSTKVSFDFITGKYYTRFSKVYGFLDNFTTGRSIVENGLKGYIISGFDLNWDLALVSIDSLGNEIWRRTFPFAHRDNLQIKKTSDNAFIIVGFRYVLKISSDGDKIWDYVVNYEDNDTEFTSIIETNDNGYLVVGTGLNSSYTTLVSLTKLNTDGKFQWIRYYDKPEGSSGFYGSYGNGIERSSDGNFILLCSTYTTNMHVYIIKVDMEGQLIWNKILTPHYYNMPKQIIKTTDNGLLILSDAISSTDVHWPRVIKIDNDGNIIWDQFYEMDAYSAKPYAICQTIDGGYAITGEINKNYTGLYKAACLLLKLKSDGAFDWEKLYSYGDDMDYWWCGYDLQQTKDFGFLITGKKSWIYYPPEKDWGYWVIKTDPIGEFE
ncbi:MAG TPA: hypothetical protein DEO60_10175 [Bacteroidales bacterium]|nr:hypothetical protein [Bacteroidales bacterium]HBZ21487.1 hypothetical protein [Bacteroidales bacterium]